MKVIAVLLAFWLAGCGGGDDPVPDDVCMVEGKPMPREACR